MTESRLSIVIDSQDSRRQVDDLTTRLNALDQAGLRATNAANDHGTAMQRSGNQANRYASSTNTATQRMSAMNGIATRLAATIATIGFTALIRNTINTADEMGKLSTRLGIAVDELSRLQYAARLTGVTTQTLNLGLQRMTRRISEAANGTGAAVGALNELNLSADALNQLSPDQQFKALADALEGVENPADKVRLAMSLLDSEGVALIQTMEGGADAIERMGEESDRTGNTITAEFAQAAADANDAMTRLTQTGQGLLNEFILILAPILEDTADFMTEYARETVFVTGAIATLTVGLKAAQLAQIGFNLAVKANPYVKVATFIGTLAAGIFSFNQITRESTNSVYDLNQELDDYEKLLRKLDKAGLEASVSADKQTVDELTKKLETLKDRKEELEELRSGRKMDDTGLILPTITSEQRDELSKLGTQIKATEINLNTWTKKLEESENALEGVNEKVDRQNKLISEQELQKAIDSLQNLQKGYNQIGLATEKYNEQKEHLNLLEKEGKITSEERAAAMAEAQKQLDEERYGISEAVSAYESLRAEFNQLGVAQDERLEKESQLATLEDRGIISKNQYQSAMAQVREEYRKTADALDPMMQAQDALAEKYIKNTRLLDQLKLATTAANQPSLPGMTPSGAGFTRSTNVQDQATADVNEVASSGLTAPSYNASDLQGTADGMETYQRQYEMRLAQLREFENAKYGVQQEATAAREALEKSHEEKMQGYREQMLGAQLSATASAAGTLMSINSQYFGEATGLQNTFMAFQKAAQIGQSIMAINTGIAQASALPFPSNIPAIASVVSATAGIVSTIMSINPPPKPSFNAKTDFAGEFAKGGTIPKGKWGLVGETGQPEIVHGPANVTGVKDTAKMLGSGDTNLSVVVNYYAKDGGGNEQQGRKDGRAIADLVKSQVLQIIQQQKRPGGSLYQ